MCCCRYSSAGGCGPARIFPAEVPSEKQASCIVGCLDEEWQLQRILRRWGASGEGVSDSLFASIVKRREGANTKDEKK